MHEAARVVPIQVEADIVTARHVGREIAASVGFNGSGVTLIATAISELARNIVVYAGSGEIRCRAVYEPDRRGVEVVASDTGPGIPDIGKAMQDGFSTGRGLGLGLPGARRLMDDFEIVSAPGRGTTVTMRKWVR